MSYGEEDILWFFFLFVSFVGEVYRLDKYGLRIKTRH